MGKTIAGVYACLKKKATPLVPHLLQKNTPPGETRCYAIPGGVIGNKDQLLQLPSLVAMNVHTTPVVFSEQRDRAQAHGWQQVEVVAHTNRSLEVLWHDERVPVTCATSGFYWASVQIEPTTTILIQEQIVKLPIEKPITKSVLPASLHERIMALDEVMRKMRRV